MKIEFGLTWKDYRSYLLNAMNRPFLKVILVVFALMIIFAILDKIGIIYSDQNFNSTEIILAWAPEIIIIIPAVLLWFFYRKYATNKEISERKTYSIETRWIRVTGKKEEVKYPWEIIDKIVENKKWFLFYQSNLVVLGIPKKYIKKEQLPLLRKYIRSHDEVINELME